MGPAEIYSHGCQETLQMHDGEKSVLVWVLLVWKEVEETDVAIMEIIKSRLRS